MCVVYQEVLPNFFKSYHKVSRLRNGLYLVCGFANRLQDWSLKNNNENLRTSKHVPSSILGSRATKELEEAGAEVCSWLPY